MLANDSVSLGYMMADALCYVHSNGGKDTQQSYVHKLSNRILQYKTCEFLTPELRLIVNVGIVTACMAASVDSGRATAIARIL